MYFCVDVFPADPARYPYLPWGWEISGPDGFYPIGSGASSKDEAVKQAMECGIGIAERAEERERRGEKKEFHPCPHCESGTWYGPNGEESCQCVYCDGSGVAYY